MTVDTEHRWSQRKKMLALLAFSFCVALAVTLIFCRPTNHRPTTNVILISLDTLRADRLGLYGYAYDTSPALDRFASEAAVFQNFIAPAPWTLPSHLSLFTGLYPSSHGITLPHGQKLAASIPLLAEILKAQGYATHGFTGGGYVSKYYGFARGFDTYLGERKSRINGQRGLAAVLTRARAAIESEQRPYFLFLHTYDIHCPYNPPEPYFSRYSSLDAETIDPAHCGTHFNQLRLTPRQARYLSDRYDGSIRRADDQLGEFFNFLRSMPDYANTVIIVTSDHGEQFLEHGRIGHKHSLHREVLHIPLLIKGPGVSPKRVDTLSSSIDVLPTILEMLSVPANAPLDGASLMPLMREGLNEDLFPAREFLFSETDREEKIRSWFGSEKHFIWSKTKQSHYLYNWREDPREEHNLSTPGIAAPYRAELSAFEETLQRNETTESAVDDEHVERLKTLGYF